MIDGGDCSMVNGCESGWAAAWGSLGAISIYITCFKKAVQACRHRDGLVPSQMFRLWGFSFVRLGVFYLWRRGFGVKTSRPEWPTGTGPPSPFRKTQTFAQTSSLDCPLWLQQRPWSAWTVCASLARTFCWLGSTGGFFFCFNEIWRMLRFIKKAS